MRLLSTGIIVLMTVISISCQAQQSPQHGQNESIDAVRKSFLHPDHTSGVNCWWWWLNGNVNKAAIKKDLEAMKSRHFQGAMIFDAGGYNQRGNSDIPKGPLFGSAKWNELFVYALDEAKKLGLEIGFNIQSGWNLGGPRVTPQYMAKQLTYSELKISGSGKEWFQLKAPPSRNNFYKDIAVLAFPINPEQRSNNTIKNLDLKLGYYELGGSAPDARFLLTNVTAGRKQGNRDSVTYTIPENKVLDLTYKMNAAGQLHWKAPKGEWCILRIGYTCTDAMVSTASGDWQGYVLDYMSRQAFDFYWEDVVTPIFKAAGKHVGTTLTYMETDSWECGGMNWTDQFSQEFLHYRGYDLKKFLPVVAGYVINDTSSSNAFLADFRKTIGDLVAHNHYEVFQEHAHQHHMGIQPESAGPHAGPMDGIKDYGFSDLVMSEFWAPSLHRPKPQDRFFVKQAASAAHIYGKKIVGAESFTSIGPHWNDELWKNQKPSFDHEICAGLNRAYFHTFTCSPPEMGLPGQEYFAGTHINPQVTWWPQSAAFVNYLHRVQSVVQKGKFVADVLYYYGDHVPNIFPYKYADPAGAMPGFDYDVCNEDILLQLKVANGRIFTPGGTSYRLLVLPDHRILSLAVLQKIDTLLKEGVTVLGYKPVSLVSLQGGQEAQATFKKLADKIWGSVSTSRGEKKYGIGKLVWGMTARSYLITQNIPADFQVSDNGSLINFDYIHYSIGDADIYFVSNQTDQPRRIRPTFRVKGKQPALWDALSGEMREAKAFTQEGGCTSVPIMLDPYGSVMVVFDKEMSESAQGNEQENYPVFSTVRAINGPWEVNFDTTWGGPGKVVFPELSDWTSNADPGIKYYSGAALYQKDFTLDVELQKDKRFFLELGQVKDVGIAELRINGVDKGVLWTAPFRCEISQDLRPGANHLEIKVVNSWYNRVAGDQSFPGQKQYTHTNINLNHDFRGQPVDKIPLSPSGLLGPVLIMEAGK